MLSYRVVYRHRFFHDGVPLKTAVKARVLLFYVIALGKIFLGLVDF